MSEMEVEEANPFSNEFGFPQGDGAKEGVQLLKEHPQHQQPKSHDLILDEFLLNTIFQPTQPVQESTGVTHIPTIVSEIPEHRNHMPQPYSSVASLELLRKFKKLKGEKLNHTRTETSVGRHKLSTEEIMKVAGARYVQFSTQNKMFDPDHMPRHPFGFGLSGLSEEEIREVELAHHLIAAAEKLDYQQYDHASRLLLHCQSISSARGNPVERIVSHFAESLQARIDKETGRVLTKVIQQHAELIQGYLSRNYLSLKMHQQLPYTQISQLTGIQAIVDNVALKCKVHLIDIGIRWGVHWTVLMQALAQRQNFPIELLKITAVGSTGNQSIEETGKRLVSVAKSLNLPFSFKSVLLSDMKDIKKELFETKKDEPVVIYASHILRTMISRPKRLENLMREIKNLNPLIMIVIEIEANQNSPLFVNRFVEALFFYSAHYECGETCIKETDEATMAMETLFRVGIGNVIAEEGTERTNRSVKIDVWRAFFKRYRMVEIKLSESSLFQANLVLKTVCLVEFYYT